jgi:hypothetical protein
VTRAERAEIVVIGGGRNAAGAVLAGRARR